MNQSPRAELSRVFADGGEMVDLSHPMRIGMPSWPTHPKFEHELVESYAQGAIACHYRVGMSEHSGTHFDAPIHFVPGGRSIDQVPLTQVMGRAACISAVHLQPCEGLEVRDLERWQKEHGRLREGDCVLLRFGWDELWDRDGEAFLRDWPGLSGEAALHLVDRGIKLVACDTLSIDTFTDAAAAPAHRALLNNDVVIGENFANLDRVPEFCMLVAFPLPIVNGSGSPVRAVAFPTT